REAQEVSEPVTLINPIAPVELFPITVGKLAVRIADEVLILHSPTEKQLSAYLEQNTLPAAAELVLSANHLSSGESMAQYAEAAGAQHIIIAASSEKGLRSHKGLDVQSTYKEGEIARQFKRSHGGKRNQTKRKITADPRPEKRRICPLYIISGEESYMKEYYLRQLRRRWWTRPLRISILLSLKARA
ncbi:MAG: hypothetical protein ACLSF2_09330, partial [Butyricicoccus sp.]